MTRTTGPGEDGEDGAASPEGAGRTGRPTVRRAVVATGEWNAGGGRPDGETPAAAAKPAVAPQEAPAAEPAGGAQEPAGAETAELPAAGGDPVAGSADDPSGQEWEQQERPSPRRGAKILLAVAGVGAVLLVAIPLLSGGGGSGDDPRTKTVGADRATSAASPQIPISSGLASTPGSSASATAQPSKSGSTTPSRAAVGRPAQGSSTSPTPHPAVAAPKKSSQASNATHPPAAPTSLVINPIAKLVHGSPWKTNKLQLGMQTDGNLVLYDYVDERVLWAAGTSGANNVAFFQSDGNLVVYNPAGHPLWASDASGYSNATLTLQSDGNLVIKSAGHPVWAAGTHF